MSCQSGHYFSPKEGQSLSRWARLHNHHPEGKSNFLLIPSPPTEAIYDCHGRKMVKEVYPRMKILRISAHFDLIYWDGIGTLITKKFTTSYVTFYTKHIVGFCGVMHHRHNIESNIPNICPCCGRTDETTDHILLCQDKGRTKLYRKSVKQLVDWMKKQQTHPMITRMVQLYLRAQKTKTMKEIYKEIGNDELEEWMLAYDHDEIGWKCFAEGRKSKRYVEIQKKWFK